MKTYVKFLALILAVYSTESAQLIVKHRGPFQHPNETGALPQLRLKTINVPLEAIEGISRNPNVEWVELDAQHAPGGGENEPYYTNQWQLRSIGANLAWASIPEGRSVLVAVCDTGANLNHADQRPILSLPGWNFYHGTTNITDPYGHGIQVIGCVSAGLNGIGIAPLAPGAMVLPLRVGDSGGYASTFHIAQAIVYAADHRARVANVSYQVWGSLSIRDAAKYMNARDGLVFVSAGNYSATHTGANDPEVIVVSALTSANNIATWSDRGSVIDLSAPGSGVYTTSFAGYANRSGTSFSSPIAAAVAALVMLANPTLNALQVRDILFSSADDLGAAGWDGNFGHGKVNARRAVDLAIATAGVPLPTPEPEPEPDPEPTDPTKPHPGKGKKK